MDEKPIPGWLEAEVLHGIDLLIQANLRFPPPLDANLEEMGRLWCRLMLEGKVWDAHQDTPRIRKAFRDMAKYRDQFPTLKELLHEIQIVHRDKSLELEHDKKPIPPDRLRKLARGMRERLQANREGATDAE